MQLTRKQIHEQVYFYTLIFIAISLPLSIYTTSMFQIILAINWLVEGRFREKWDTIKGEQGALDHSGFLPGPRCWLDVVGRWCIQSEGHADKIADHALAADCGNFHPPIKATGEPNPAVFFGGSFCCIHRFRF